MTGEHHPCCYSSFSYGSFRDDGLENTWNSEKARWFRSKIAAGEFPDSTCENCYSTGTPTPFSRTLAPVFNHAWSLVFQYACDRGVEVTLGECAAVKDFFQLFSEKELEQSGRQSIKRFSRLLSRLRAVFDPVPDVMVEKALEKLELCIPIVRSYLTGDESPEVVAPYRQVYLVARCNARCIHCVGLFTGEISRGLTLLDGSRGKVMQAQEANEAFARSEHIISFFMGGSEFLLYKDWRGLANTLHASGVRLSVSSNGVLLNRSNVDFLFSEPYLANLNLSIDGATRETIEAIRVNVKYDDLVGNIDYLIDVMETTSSQTTLGFSFLLIKRNYQELPMFFDFLDRLRRGRSVSMNVTIQSLDHAPNDEYKDFMSREHLANVEEASLRGVFSEAALRSAKLNIPATAFFSWNLTSFVENNVAFPKLGA